jgi:hypothetical protein
MVSIDVLLRYAACSPIEKSILTTVAWAGDRIGNKRNRTNSWLNVRIWIIFVVWLVQEYWTSILLDWQYAYYNRLLNSLSGMLFIEILRTIEIAYG